MVARFAFYVAAITAVLLGPADAKVVTLPTSVVGDWCYSSQDGKETSYQLPSWTEGGHCTKILSIGQYEFHTEGQNCDPVSIKAAESTAPSGTSYKLVVTSRCRADGETGVGKSKVYEFDRYKGNMYVRERP
jgi:hypothetical protein